MSLLYYILLRINGDFRSKVLFLLIQLIWFVLLPLFLVESSIFNIQIEKENKPLIIIIAMILLEFFNFKNYHREINEKKILKRYTYKYKIIDNYPMTCFFLSYFTLLFFGLFLSMIIV